MQIITEVGDRDRLKTQRKILELRLISRLPSKYLKEFGPWNMRCNKTCIFLGSGREKKKALLP